MCQLQETTFACGHTRKTLLQACTTAQKLSQVPPNRAPDFCLGGLHVVDFKYSDDSCGRVNRDRLTCKDVQILQELDEAKTQLQQTVVSYIQRIKHVEDVFKLGVEPDCNWDRFQHDPASYMRIKREQQELRSSIIPDLLKSFQDKLAEVEEEVDKAYGIIPPLMRLIMTGSQDNIEPHSDIADFLERDFGDIRIAVDPVRLLSSRLRGTFHTLAVDLYFQVIALEQAAVDACLDDVGWIMPEDGKWLLQIAQTRALMPRKQRNAIDNGYSLEPSKATRASELRFYHHWMYHEAYLELRKDLYERDNRDGV